MWGLSRPGIESVFPALEVDSQPLDHQGSTMAALCALKVILGLVARSSLTLWTVPMGCSPPGSSLWRFSRQEYWCGLPSLSPGKVSLHPSYLCPHPSAFLYSTKTIAGIVFGFCVLFVLSYPLTNTAFFWWLSFYTKSWNWLRCALQLCSFPELLTVETIWCLCPSIQI